MNPLTALSELRAILSATQHDLYDPVKRRWEVMRTCTAVGSPALLADPETVRMWVRSSQHIALAHYSLRGFRWPVKPWEPHNLVGRDVHPEATATVRYQTSGGERVFLAVQGVEAPPRVARVVSPAELIGAVDLLWVMLATAHQAWPDANPEARRKIKAAETEVQKARKVWGDVPPVRSCVGCGAVPRESRNWCAACNQRRYRERKAG